ncbi:hypothetical protein RISW2_11450 [Roseivivax isoporae LMG 25204]|uniref:Glycine transporter domain-containing protein n=1 Tax=Roseivivax isoporae LMG 25204 TaxID=1449351 RepID=X7F6U8_9RHOB|nr:hypothetical protein RISW2_11450 [Roseivivax isoporae LMG 25204]
MLLDRPVFWIEDPTYLFVGSAAAVVVFFTAHLLESRYAALRWVDAAALSVAVAAGSGIAAGLDQPPPVIVLMGMITGCMGGLARDVVTNEMPMVLRPGELYVTCAFAGALVTATADRMGVTGPVPALACATICFVLRAGSLRYGWYLPGYCARPPRR